VGNGDIGIGEREDLVEDLKMYRFAIHLQRGPHMGHENCRSI
jgi:hypothetical protein